MQSQFFGDYEAGSEEVAISWMGTMVQYYRLSDQGVFLDEIVVFTQQGTGGDKYWTWIHSEVGEWTGPNNDVPADMTVLSEGWMEKAPD